MDVFPDQSCSISKTEVRVSSSVCWKVKSSKLTGESNNENGHSLCIIPKFHDFNLQNRSLPLINWTNQSLLQAVKTEHDPGQFQTKEELTSLLH